MPDLIGPLLPKFDDDRSNNKALKKAAQYLIGYSLAITIAKTVPKTAGPLGFLTGLNLQPGKGITVKPLAVPLLYAPQPVGVVQPSVYGLPDVIGDPIEVFKLATTKNPDVAFANRFNDDLQKQKLEKLANEERSRRSTPAFQRELFADLAEGRLPRVPRPADVLNVKIGLDGLPFVPPPGLDTRPGVSVVGLLADRVEAIAGLLGAAEVVPGRVGSIPVIEPAQGENGTAQVIENLQRLDRFGRLNPPDP